MIGFSIRHNFPDVARKMRQLEEDVAAQVMARALNDSIKQGQAEMARRISREFVITQAKVRERLKIVRASYRPGAIRLVATLEATKRAKGRSMNLIAFTKGKTLGKAGAKRLGDASLSAQLKFQIKRGSGPKIIKGAFISNQGRTVFIREGKSRFPIRALNTIDIPQMFNTRRINKVVRDVLLARFQANFDRNLRVVVEGFAR